MKDSAGFGVNGPNDSGSQMEIANEPHPRAAGSPLPIVVLEELPKHSIRRIKMRLPYSCRSKFCILNSGLLVCSLSITGGFKR
jgi:hypothetical protein